MKHQVHCLEPRELELFLERHRQGQVLASETSLAENLVEILHRANELVPSDAGSILLDDPTMQALGRDRNRLTFLAAFGEKSESLTGQSIEATEGIAGHVYRTGEAYYAADAQKDRFFHKGIDETTDFTTRALVAIPIKLGGEVCGVLELIRQEGFTHTECELLDIFAGYLSVSIQNVLDARHAQALARQDNLTGLYNDRYLHVALEDHVVRCAAADSDVAVLFLDLDYFKRVNDSHGHLTGSQVLHEVGRLLAEVGERNRGTACRYGGDEFVVILPQCELERAIWVAEDIRSRIANATFCSQPGIVQPQPLRLNGLTCSLGVATMRRHVPDTPLDETRTLLLHLADAAMYLAKETGRNRTVVADEPARRRRATEDGPPSQRSAVADP